MRRVPVRLGNRARYGSVDVEEERFVLAAVEKRDSLAREGVGQVFLLVRDRLAVADERIVVGLARQVGPRAAEETVVVIEAAFVRAQAFLESDVPFANHAGGVAERLEFLGERRFGAWQAKVLRREPFRAGVVLEAVAMLVAPAHQTRARRRADGVRRVAVGEPHAADGDAVNLRRRDVLAAVHANAGVAKVVGQEDDDVRLLLRGERRREQAERREDDEDVLHGLGSTLTRVDCELLRFKSKNSSAFTPANDTVLPLGSVTFKSAAVCLPRPKWASSAPPLL